MIKKKKCSDKCNDQYGTVLTTFMVSSLRITTLHQSMQPSLKQIILFVGVIN